MTAAVDARDRFAAWAGAELGLPCFLYGPERIAAGRRRNAFHDLAPDTGPAEPHPHRGCLRGRRPAVARRLQPLAGERDARRREATRRRGTRARRPRPGPRPSATHVQVCMNLLAPLGWARRTSTTLSRRTRRSPGPSWSGWYPLAVLDAPPPARWARARSRREPHHRGPAPGDRLLRRGRLRPRRRRPGERGPAGGGCGDAHARSCRPRCRTSRR